MSPCSDGTRASPASTSSSAWLLKVKASSLRLGLLMNFTEQEIHTSIVAWLQLALPAQSVVHHSPNEGRHHVAYRQKQKKMGMQTGWPDLELFVPDQFFVSGESRPIFLEVKSKKGRLRDTQIRILEQLRDLACHVCVVRSIDETEDFLSEIIKLRAT